jgi:hypothetical protein
MSDLKAPSKAKKILSASASLLGVLLLFALTASVASASVPNTKATPPSEVTARRATLNGVLEPSKNGEPAEYQFLYAPSASQCNSPEPERAPESPATSGGNENEAVHAEAFLHPDQVYTYCLTAKREGETSQSAPQTFKTPPSAPRVEPETVARSVTPFSATLEAVVNPNNQETTYSFTYATNEALTEHATTIPGKTPLPAVYEFFSPSVETGGVLTPSTIYYFQLTATNATGTSQSSVEHFQTAAAEAPSVIAETLSALHTSEPKLSATINPNFQQTTYRFEYATDEALSENLVVIAGAPPAPALPGISAERQTVPVGLPGLLPGPTYFYRVVATNASGTTLGPVQSFQALAPPAVTTGIAQSLGRTTANVSGTVTPNGLPTLYHFAYVSDSAYKSALAEGAADPYATGRVTQSVSVTATGYEAQPAAAMLEGLTAGTTYHYVLVAQNELDSTIGADATVTTAPAMAPLATTGPSEGVSELSATITASVDTRGLPTSFQFEFGTTPFAGSLLPAVATGTTGSIITLTSSFVNDLLPATTYYYRIVAAGRDGTVYGAEQSFRTAALTPTLSSGILPAVIPYTTIPELNAKEAAEAPKLPTPRKPLTRAQRLARAMRACGHVPRSRRASCRRHAIRAFGPRKKGHRR